MRNLDSIEQFRNYIAVLSTRLLCTVMMYSNPLLIVWAINYTESVLHICLLYDVSGLTYSKSILVNSCKCTVQLTEHTGREPEFYVFFLYFVCFI